MGHFSNLTEKIRNDIAERKRLVEAREAQSDLQVRLNEKKQFERRMSSSRSSGTYNFTLPDEVGDGWDSKVGGEVGF